MEFNLSNHDREFMQDWFSDMVNGSGYGTRCEGIPFLIEALFRLVRGWPQTHPSCYDTTETHFTSNPEEGFQRFRLNRLIYTSEIYFYRSSYFDKLYELAAKNTLKGPRNYSVVSRFVGIACQNS
jgi:hypothetical protein